MSHATRAESLARFHHEGQFRRDKVTPYIRHVEAVVKNMGETATDEELAAAWLHDVLEDCPVGMSALAEIGMPHTVQRAVLCLTRQEDEDYDAFVRRAASDPIACKVKIADIMHNISDRPSEAARARYRAALNYLTQ